MSITEKLCIDGGLGCSAIGTAIMVWLQAAGALAMFLGGAILLGMRLWLTWREIKEKRAKKNAPE